jgi:hypothetical protein
MKPAVTINRRFNSVKITLSRRKLKVVEVTPKSYSTVVHLDSAGKIISVELCDCRDLVEAMEPKTKCKTRT